MIRKINEKARRALKKSLMLGGALLFIAAAAGCDMLSAADATGFSNGIRASKHYPTLQVIFADEEEPEHREEHTRRW